MTPPLWPAGKRVAVAVTVMFETWADDAFPPYSVQATGLRAGTFDHAGKAWSTYGGRVGVWRILRTLDRLGVPATFFTNARCVEQYPDAVRQIVRGGYDLAGHGYTQDALLAYMTPEQERTTIRRSIGLLDDVAGPLGGKVTGWLSPVLAFTPNTVDLLAEAGLRWHADVSYSDIPHRIETKHGPLGAVPHSDFTDNRVLKSNVRDLFDVHRGTFDYLYRNEPMSMMAMTLHCQFGGRPLVIAVFEDLIRYFRQFPDVWFASHKQLAEWALAQDVAEHVYRERYGDA